MVFFFFYGSRPAQYSYPEPQFSTWSQVNSPIPGSTIVFRAPSWCHLLCALWIGGDTFQTNQWLPWPQRILRNKEVMVEYCSMLPLLFIWLPLISPPALAKLAGTQAPFSKTMKHKRLLSLCFESTGFSSDWVAANYPPCNYGDPRSKQMGKSFVFKWRRNQYVGRKGSLFIWTDSRWLVAKRQRAGEPGLALDQSGCPQTRGTSEATGSAPPHHTCLPAASLAGSMEAKGEAAHRGPRRSDIRPWSH